MERRVTWENIGLPELYGPILVHTTDPTKSNSENMFASLLANVLNDNQVVTMSTVDSIIPRVKIFF